MTKKSIIFVLIFIFLLSGFSPISSTREFHKVFLLKPNSFSIETTENGKMFIKMHEFFSFYKYSDKNKIPALPYKIYKISIPKNTIRYSVKISQYKTVDLGFGYYLMSAPNITNKRNSYCTARYGEENSQEIFPAKNVEILGDNFIHGERKLLIKFIPFIYNSKNGNLKIIEEVKIEIDGNYKLGLRVDKEEKNGYLILSTDEIINSDVLDKFITFKELSGFKVYVVSINSEEIREEKGDKIEDKVRNYLKQKYREYNLKYLLIIGSIKEIPMKYVYPNPENHALKEKDKYAWEIPTDYYYADLTGDWDSDKDGYPGEVGDDEFDIFPEIYVGRIPFNSKTIVKKILERTIYFEKNVEDLKNNFLGLGAFSNFKNEEDPETKEKFEEETDGAYLVESLWKNSLSKNGFEIVRMYEKEGIRKSKFQCDYPLNLKNVKEHWLNGEDFKFVVWSAHGWERGAARKWWEKDDGDGIAEEDEIEWESFIMSDLISDKVHTGYIVASSSCLNAYPEDEDNIMATLLKYKSVITIGGARELWYSIGWKDETWGGCDSVVYYTIRNIVTNKETVGESLFDAKIETTDPKNIYDMANLYGYVLYGDPSLSVESYVNKAPLNPPILKYPQNYSKNIVTSATLKWKHVSRSEEYRLQISTDKYFNNLIYEKMINKNYIELEKGILKPNTVYYWRVLSKNEFGESKWSRVWRFKTGSDVRKSLFVEVFIKKDNPIYKKTMNFVEGTVKAFEGILVEIDPDKYNLEKNDVKSGIYVVVNGIHKIEGFNNIKRDLNMILEKEEEYASPVSIEISQKENTLNINLTKIDIEFPLIDPHIEIWHIVDNNFIERVFEERIQRFPYAKELKFNENYKDGELIVIFKENGEVFNVCKRKFLSPIPPPKNINLNLSKGGVEISWESVQTSNIEGYRILKGDRKDSMEIIAEVSKDTNYFFDDNVELDKRYFYTVVAFDENGNTSKLTEIKSIIIKDISPPEIEISGGDNITTGHRDFILKGNVSDDFSKNIEVFVNGEKTEVTYDGGFQKYLLLNAGLNKIEIEAVDESGNRSQKVINVEFIDSSPPEILVSLPAETFDKELKVTGEIVDDSKVNLKINGILINLNKDKTFEYNWALTPGTNKIKFVAKDEYGNVMVKEYFVTYKILMRFQIGDTLMFLNDDFIEIDAPPTIVGGRTLLPIRWIAEPIGANVSWDGKERKVTIILNDTTIELWIGKPLARVNGIEKPIDPNNLKVVPMILNGRTMLPVRFVAENLGCRVEWDPTTRTVTIIYPKN